MNSDLRDLKVRQERQINYLLFKNSFQSKMLFIFAFSVLSAGIK